jgi:hypothetical protein
MYEPLSVSTSIIAVILFLWTIPWKVYAVWHAVKNNDKKWFVALLFLNTLAILELVYIFKILNKSWREVSEDFRMAWRSGTK